MLECTVGHTHLCNYVSQVSALSPQYTPNNIHTKLLLFSLMLCHYMQLVICALFGCCAA